MAGERKAPVASGPVPVYDCVMVLVTGESDSRALELEAATGAPTGFVTFGARRGCELFVPTVPSTGAEG